MPDGAAVSGSSTQAVTATEVTGFASPAALAADGTKLVSAGLWRFPSTDTNEFVDGLYSVSTNSWALELRDVNDGWGEYQVTLYVYPTLSTAIHYTTEVYRVNGAAWDIVVSGSDVFEELKSIYFDGREETRSPFSVSGFAGGQIWDTGYFIMPEDMSNPAYDYPETIVDPAVGTDGSYAIGVSGSIEYANNISGYDWDLEAEYYLEVPAGVGVEKYTKSYDSLTWVTSTYDIAINTVRIAFEDVDGNQEQRAKSEVDVEYTVRGTTSSYRMELTNVVERGGGAFTDTTEVTSNADGVTTPVYTATLDLNEDATGEYSGTMTYAYQNGSEVVWNYTLTRSNGLTMQNRVTNAAVSFNNGSVASDIATAAAGYGTAGVVDPERVMTVDAMDNGGSFAGVYTRANGNQFEVEVTPGTASVDGRAIDVANADL